MTFDFTDKKDKIKLIVAIVVLAAAGVILAIQLFPSSSKPVANTAAAPEEDAKVDAKGNKVVRFGARRSVEPAPKK